MKEEDKKPYTFDEDDPWGEESSNNDGGVLLGYSRIDGRPIFRDGARIYKILPDGSKIDIQNINWSLNK